ncbi:hypothetical protein B0H13DRAFT_2235087 [Mycena leptocephala]|nr:hypothetical protein B0H13DRAFT_2235087 [Mycena leptocephala]
MPSHTVPDDRNGPRAVAWACFRRMVYHKSLRRPSRNGETVKCGDGIDRVLFPGIPYHSLDGEEACTLCACRAAMANFPCPRCLVPQAELHSLLKEFTLRTTATMRRVYEDALAARNKTEQESLLQFFGLHLTENFFWSLSNSDPYRSYTYDVLHGDDLGKWGKHLYLLLLRSFYDILKVGLTYYGNLNASNQHFKHNKKFDSLKQHASVHLIDDLREKATMNHHITRQRSVLHTNGKNEDPQLARIDENQEAIALIQMRADQSDQACQSGDETESDQHWSCGSSEKWTTSRIIEDEMKRDQRYVKFDAKVRKSLTNEVSEQFGDTTMMRRHHCLYLKYQSLEDWTERRDIVRCNPSFHGHLRRDYVLVNTTDSADLLCAHLYDLFTCKSLDGRQHDIAPVSMLKHSSWRPNTLWDGCRAYEEPKESQLMFMKYFIRGPSILGSRMCAQIKEPSGTHP